MKILIITLNYPPDKISNAALVQGLAREWANLGCEVKVITACPHTGGRSQYPDYAGWRLRRENDNGVSILRVPVLNGNHNTPAGKILSWLSFNVFATPMALFAGRPDVVFSLSPPFTLGLIEWFISLFKRVPYVYNVQDIYPDIAVQQGYLKNRLMIRFFRRIEDLIYSKAAAVTVLSEAHRENLLRKGVPGEKTFVIPNFVDTDFVHPLPKDNLWARQQNLSDRFVVLYAGNMGPSQGLETVLEAARRLRDRGDICFLFVGRGTEKDRLEEKARMQKLDNVRFLSFQPIEQVPQVYGAADVCLVVLKSGVRGSVPSKVYSIFAAGRVVIASADDQGEIGRLVKTADAGLVVSPENPEALAEGILSLKADEVKRRFYGDNGRNYVVAHCSKKVIPGRYYNLFAQLTSKKVKGRINEVEIA